MPSSHACVVRRCLIWVLCVVHRHLQLKRNRAYWLDCSGAPRHLVTCTPQHGSPLNLPYLAMTKFSGLIVSICLLLTACAHQKTQPDVQYDPATDARVRVYFGVATKFFFNTTCYPKHGGKAATKPRVFNLANTTIGMPVPADAERYY